MPSSEVFNKFKAGTLRSGSGKKVTSRNQAIAIKMHEHAKELANGGKYPERKKR